MKIVYVITRADAVGGASIHVRDVARAMIDRGHQATVLAGGEGPVSGQLAAVGVPYRSLRFLDRPIHPLRDLRAVFEIVSALRGLRPDLVSAHTAKAGWIARAACALVRIPAVYTPHGWSIGHRISKWLGPVFTIAEMTASRFTAAIICVCNEEKRLALSKRVAPAAKLHVVHNAVRDIPASLRSQPAIEPVRICSVARFESPKDHATLLHAMAAIQALPWELDLVGDGPLEPDVRALAHGLGIAARVRFLGYMADPSPALAAAQIFVLSSRSEAFPRSVLEAMRAGLPIVASRVGGLNEAVTPGVNGLLVPAESAPFLAGALTTLMRAPALRDRMGAASRAFFESRFRFDSMVENTAAIYATVLGRTAQTRRTD